MHVLTEENLSRYMENQEENSQAAVISRYIKSGAGRNSGFSGKGHQGEIYNFVESYLGGIM